MSGGGGSGGEDGGFGVFSRFSCADVDGFEVEAVVEGVFGVGRIVVGRLMWAWVVGVDGLGDWGSTLRMR